MKSKFFLIKKRNEGERIDKFLKNKFLESSRAWLQNLIKEGLVTVNDKKIEPKYNLKENDRLKIRLKKKKEVKISPNSDVNLEIIFENDNLLVLNKPSGILVHPTTTSKNEKVLTDELLNYCPKIYNVGENHLRPGLVHRLDKNTSGLMVVAKNQDTFLKLKDLFKSRKIEKTYQALVHGFIKKKEGVFESYIGRSNKDPRKRISLPKPRQGIKTKKASTYYKVIEYLKDKSDNLYTLLELKIKTGRTHQIRSQFFSINYPLVGDSLYKIKGIPIIKLKRVFLHAQKLEFSLNSKYYQFYSPLPPDLKNFLSHLKQCQII